MVAALTALLALVGGTSAIAPAGASTLKPPPTAAARFHWGKPTHADEFGHVGAPSKWWSVYNGLGHHNQGHRSPKAWRGNGSVMTVKGDAHGTTGGMSANWKGSDVKGGRWEVRMRTSARDPRYHPVLILWPQDGYKRGKCDGEVDFSESTRNTGQTHFYLHHGCANKQTSKVITNNTRAWHTYAVEWVPGRWMRGFIDGRLWFADYKVGDLPPRPMHLTLQLDYFPKDGKGALKPSWMQVDWARQYPLHR